MNSELNSSNSDSEYEVERIDGKRYHSGGIQYFIKWKNYSEEDNTWEPIENLSCGELIKEYEASNLLNKNTLNTEKTTKKRKVDGKNEKKAVQPKRKRTESDSNFKERDENDSGRQPKISKFLTSQDVERIWDMKLMDGEIMYLVEYKNSEKSEWIPMKYMKRNHPQKVIAFYEDCITWQD